MNMMNSNSLKLQIHRFHNSEMNETLDSSFRRQFSKSGSTSMLPAAAAWIFENLAAAFDDFCCF